jgi:hypothetical protein
MMQISLSVVEQQLVLRLLDQELGDVRSGVRRTHNPEWKDGLKKEETVLRELIGKLRTG